MIKNNGVKEILIKVLIANRSWDPNLPTVFLYGCRNDHEKWEEQETKRKMKNKNEEEQENRKVPRMTDAMDWFDILNITKKPN